jgi:hypothetical protein
MNRCSYALFAAGLAVLALWAEVRADEPPAAADVGKPRPATEGLQPWQYYLEVAQPRPGEGSYYDFIVPPAVFDKANESLSDLRLRDAKDREIPYALFVRRATTRPEERQLRQFNPTTEPDRTVSVSLEVQGEGRHNEIAVATSGADYRRRVKVESSDDRNTWKDLLDAELIFFQAGKQVVDVRKFSYAENRRRYLRVTVHPDPGKKDDKPEIQGVTVREAVEEPGEDVTLPAQLGPREGTRLDGTSGSVWSITFNNQRVPVERLIVEANEPVFEREYRLEMKTEEQAEPLERLKRPFTPVTSGAWRRGFELARKPLEIRLPGEMFVKELRLSVVDANNPPLTITSVRYQAPARQVIFAKSAEIEWPVRVYFGNPAAQEPAYDFRKTVSPRAEAVRLEVGSDPQRNPVYQAPPVPWSERHPWLVYVVLGIASVVLFAIMALLAKQALARTAPPPAPQPQAP